MNRSRLPFLEFYHLIDLHILSMSLVLQKNHLKQLFLAKLCEAEVAKIRPFSETRTRATVT